MEAWIWFAVGIGLLAGELVIPTGFYLLILGLACLLVGALTLATILVGWTAQVVVFSVSSVGIWYLFGESLQGLLGSKDKEYRGLLGQTATTKEDIAPGAKGGGELWGSPWRLENIGSTALSVGDECEVCSSDGLVLKVKKKE